MGAKTNALHTDIKTTFVYYFYRSKWKIYYFHFLLFFLMFWHIQCFPATIVFLCLLLPPSPLPSEIVDRALTVTGIMTNISCTTQHTCKLIAKSHMQMVYQFCKSYCKNSTKKIKFKIFHISFLTAFLFQDICINMQAVSQNILIILNIPNGSYLEYPWNIFGICSNYIALCNGSHMEHFAVNRHKKIKWTVVTTVAWAV